MQSPRHAIATREQISPFPHPVKSQMSLLPCLFWSSGLPCLNHMLKLARVQGFQLLKKTLYLI